jgi:ATP-dependent DNA helicase RecG
MELAIAEMNKSKNEPRPDGKVPPKVGAVVVFPDCTAQQAHRGELREGDHAEYTLLERKLHNEKLDDCILFTTLEPCAKRNNPKVPCCRRTTNARIKTVYVGIGDPDPTVDGKGIKHLENHGVKVLMFDRDLQKQIETENTHFISQAIERKNKFEVEEDSVPALEQAVPTANFDELSAEALQKFIIAAKLNFKLEAKPFQKYLADMGILALDKASKQLKPTGLGILLFGINPRLLYKQAALKCTVDYGNDKIETKEFNQALVLIPDLIEEWIIKVLPQVKDTSSFKRKNISEFPIEVLREAIINALVHRDYSIEGAKSYFQITQDSIVVKNPGGPLPSITLQQLNTFKAPSISRNPIITYVFNLMDYVDETGFGMSTLQSLHSKYGLPTPQYTLEKPFLTLTFPRNIEAVKTVNKDKGVDKLTDEELAGYDWIKGFEEISAKDYSTQFNISPRTASRHLSKMLAMNLLTTNNESIKSPKLRYKIT